MFIFGLMGGDFVFCFLTTIIDAKYYIGNKAANFFINLFLFLPLLITVIILLIIKRKKQCIAGGFIYLIGGIIIWISKIFYFIYLIISGSLEKNYGKTYSKSVNLVCFMINFLVIFFRLGACYIIKGLYEYVIKLEEILHLKEQAEFIQSLGTKGENEERLCDDEEITEEILGKDKKNPFITGREKKEDNEEEEINFKTTY